MQLNFGSQGSSRAGISLILSIPEEVVMSIRVALAVASMCLFGLAGAASAADNRIEYILSLKK